MPALVNDLIGRVADKWTMIALEVLPECGELRLTRLARQMLGISQNEHPIPHDLQRNTTMAAARVRVDPS